MDALSAILGAIRLKGALYFEVRAAEPWVSVSPSMTDIGSVVMPDGEHVIPFHIMMSGRAWARPADGSLPSARLESGNIIMFPAGASHVMSSDCEPGDLPDANLQVYRDAAQRDAPFTLLEIGGQGEQAVFVCGYLCCDAGPFNPLLGALPPMLIVRPPADAFDLTRNLIRAALDENGSGETGSETMLAKLSELMFVQALRWHINSLSNGHFGWLSALRDERVARALHLIHTRPTEHWSLASLAEASAASRSRLASDFHHFTGESPMRYLARWRMQLAAGMLQNSAVSIGQVAERVGYESEAAFKRTFKKFVGSPPGQWRRAMRAPHMPLASGKPSVKSRTTAHLVLEPRAA